MGITRLRASLIKADEVEADFQGRGGGTAKWQWIVDGFVENVEAIARDSGRRFEKVNPWKTAGQGSPLRMPLAVYVKARLSLERMDEAREAMRDGTFEIDEDRDLAAIVRRVRAALAPKVA